MLSPRKFSRKSVIALALTAWLLAVCGAFAALAGRDARSGDSGAPPSRWPNGRLNLAPAPKFTLVVGAHPRCPCTRATAEELARLMAVTQGVIEARVLVLDSATEADWAVTDLVHELAAIPGVLILRDKSGVEATAFGLATSGHVLLYDANGLLRFSGGITPGRGHEGDSLGQAAILRIARGEPTSAASAPVFGCRLGTGPSIRRTPGGNRSAL